MSLFSQAAAYWRFAWGLRGFLREPVTLEQSREIIRQRLQNREQNLLAMVKRAIYNNEVSPYLKLLRWAGCEYGDFEKMVRSDGVESALRKICEAGVYISIEEFKGKKEVSRGGKVFKFKESDFDNPFLVRHIETSSGASRSAGTRTSYDFDFLTQLAAYRTLLFDAYDIHEIPIAFWYPILPGNGPLTLFVNTKAGKPPQKWFSQVAGRNIRPSFKKRLATAYIVYGGRFFGAKWPSPEYVSLDDAWKVAQWIADTIKKQGGCHLQTYTSTAVRICQAAREKGLDIAGAKFFIAGEPLTQVKRKEIESVGASACPQYIFSEGGCVGMGCFNSVAADDVHLLKDSSALIQHQREVSHAGVSVNAFLFTSLLPSAPKVLFNMESGDYGLVESRSCGCKFEEFGFTDHIYNIRGFDKLTGEGMTFFGTDLIGIIEEVLPAKFGGTSTDYQMVEEEDEQGRTRLNVLVSPEVGEIDESELVQTVVSELSKGKDTQRMMTEIWSQVEMLRVKRVRPLTTAAGKLLPLHIQRGKSTNKVD